MSDLLKLADECERVVEPSAELNCVIGVAIGEFAMRPNQNYNNRIDYVDIRRKGHEIWPGYGGDKLVPDYTGSLDRALKLIPKDWFFAGFEQQRPSVRVWTEGNIAYYSPEGGPHAATPALALCAASLRARARVLSDVGSSPTPK